MGQDEILWEPVWDFSLPGEPLIPATLPYSLDDPAYTGWLKKNFRYGLQLCLPIYGPNNERVWWRDLAAELGHDFRSGVDFWEAINVLDDRVQRELVSRVEQPYFGMIDIGTWQSLRQIFGLPDAGICYADFLLYSPGQTGPIPHEEDHVRRSPGGYRYFVGRCLGETTEGVFMTESGASCCWVEGEWFIAVDTDLTRGVVCYNSPDYTAVLSASEELETYPLWSPILNSSPFPSL